MVVRRDLLNFILIEIVCMIIVGSTIFTGSITSANFIDKERLIGIMSIINIVLYFIALKKTRDEIFSIQSMFTMFMYLFNLGMPISRLMGWVGASTETFLSYRIYPMGYDTYITYLVYAFLLITFMEIGILYYYGKGDYEDSAILEKEESTELIDSEYESELNRCNTIGKILMAIGVIPYVYSEVTFLINAIAYGYQSSESTYNLSGTGFGLLGQLFLLGFIMTMFSCKNERNKFDAMFYTMTVYQLVRMFLSGDRSTGLVIIFVLIFMRHKFVSPIKGSRALLYCLLIYAGMLFVKLVEMTRSNSDPNMNEIISQLFQSNMLAETITEYGGNVWCGMMVFYLVPSTAYYRCGLTYIAALIGKPLSLLGINSSIWRFADFSNFINDSSNSVIQSVKGAMGGSFSGEWFYNFGWVGIVLIPIFGYFLAKISDIAGDTNKTPILSSFWLYMSTLIIWWVRQYFTSVSWYAIFCGAVLFVLSNVIKRRSE